MLLSWFIMAGLIYGTCGERAYKIKVKDLFFNVPRSGLVANASVKLTAYNETVTCITGFLELIGQIPASALIGVTGHERSKEDKNTYQARPTVNYTVNICDFLLNDDTIMPELLLVSNVEQICPPRPKNYTIDCFNVEAKSLPDQIPGEEHWLFTVSIYEKNSTLSPVWAYAVAAIHFDSSEYKKNKSGRTG